LKEEKSSVLVPALETRVTSKKDLFLVDFQDKTNLDNEERDDNKLVLKEYFTFSLCKFDGL
jgi:hypothetical protein